MLEKSNNLIQQLEVTVNSKHIHLHAHGKAYKPCSHV